MDNNLQKQIIGWPEFFERLEIEEEFKLGIDTDMELEIAKIQNTKRRIV